MAVSATDKQHDADWLLKIQGVLGRPAGGVVGLVDDLLALCRECRLELDWQDGQCRVRSRGGEWQSINVSLRTSVFRAILARVATLCNERSTKSVSPYGGLGEVSVGTDSTAPLSITFVNTPQEQKLKVTQAAVAR